jgi:hypothetical protein
MLTSFPSNFECREAAHVSPEGDSEELTEPYKSPLEETPVFFFMQTPGGCSIPNTAAFE